MNLSEKLYSLRKKSGLSQEQLAEQLNVSRQAISKGESGTAVPETEKLIAISKYFNVSMDYLVKDEISTADTYTIDKGKDTIVKYIGLVLCIAGFVSLLIWGIIIAFCPSASQDVAASSAITLDGRAVLLIAFFLLVAIGAFLLLKKQKGDRK